MRKTLFFEPLILYIGFVMYLVIVLVSGSLFLSALNIGRFFEALVIFVVFVGTIYFVLPMLWQRVDYLVVADTYAEWRCFLKRRRRVYYGECRYIAVENFNKESHGPMVRGDEFAMIYLSLDPYPEELRGKINRLRCTDRIIKFRYSDKLARAILAVAPEEKTRLLYAFYNQMQNYDRRMERQRKNRKKKKRRG